MRESADPVRGLLHRHGAMCARAVDPLEIAAVLEARGITDRTAARFRHRDVFSLAEELYARAPRPAGGLPADRDRPQDPPRPHGPGHRGDTDHRAGPEHRAPAGTPPPAWNSPARGVPPVADHRASSGRDRAPGPGRPPRVPARPGVRGLAALLPAALCALALASVSLLPETARPAVVAAGVLLTLLAVRWGVLRATPPGVAATVPALLLLGYLLAGDAVLGEALRQPAATPQPGTGELAAVSGLTLALAAAPAAWLVRRFGDRAGNRLARSRSLTEFTGVVRPLLATTGALMLSALLAAYALAWTVVHAPHPPPPDVAALATTVATGLLLATAMLLIAYERRTAAAAGLAAAGLTLALLLALACASWLPPLRPLGAPLEQLVRSAGGPATLSAVVCSLAAAALLITAAQVLSSPWPHYALPAPRPSGGPPRRVRPAAAPATPGGTVRHPCPQPAAGPSGGRD